MSWNSFFSTTRHSGSKLSGAGAPMRWARLRDGLGGDQRALGGAVAALDAALRRQRRAMQLEIDFAATSAAARALRASWARREEFVDAAPARAAAGRENRARLLLALDHFRASRRRRRRR